jgi:hypothetical protein
MTLLSYTNEEKSDEDEDFSFEEAELQRIANSVESPLSAYARYLARLDATNPHYANILRLQYPVTKLVKADIMYARKTWKNRLFTINGAPGTFKSFSAITICDWLDQNGFWTHNKGNYSLPKLFFNTIDLMNYLQSEAKKGDTLMLDEEIDKCLAFDTKIRTISGDIEIGTLFKLAQIKNKEPFVYSYDFLNNKIISKGVHISYSGDKQLLRIAFEDGSYVDCSEDHRLFTKGMQIKRASEITVGTEIAFLEEHK